MSTLESELAVTEFEISAELSPDASLINDTRNIHNQQNENMFEIISESQTLNTVDGNSNSELPTFTPTHTTTREDFDSSVSSTAYASTQQSEKDVNIITTTHSCDTMMQNRPVSNFSSNFNTKSIASPSPGCLDSTTAKILAGRDVDNLSQTNQLQIGQDKPSSSITISAKTNESANIDGIKTTAVCDYNIVPENGKSHTHTELQTIGPVVEKDEITMPVDNNTTENYNAITTAEFMDDETNVTDSSYHQNDINTIDENYNPSEMIAMESNNLDVNCRSTPSIEEDSDVIEKEPPTDSSSSPESLFMCVDTVSKEFLTSHQENYLRGCKWSPDGTEVLTNSNDNILRTFTPNGQRGQEMTSNCVMKQSGIVYDFAWYPLKEDCKPESCRIACSCPGNPIHLWDSNGGSIVSSYRAFDHCDELTSAYSLSFSPDGSKIYGGYKNSIRIFDTEYSHRACTLIKTLDPKTKEGHKGIISCFCHGTPESNTFVTGSYSRHVGVYYTLANKLVCLIQGQQGGVTHIALSPDGRKLYTGGRKDPEIVCWDMRNLGQVYCTYLRDVQTNQRIYFDLSPSGRYLVSGNHDGSVQAWDTTQPGEEMNGEMIVRPCHAFQAHADCVNGVSFHPQGVMVATASGKRHFTDVMSDDSDDDDDKKGDDDKKDFSMKIWSTPWF